MKFKILIIVHLVGIALALLRLCFIPIEDHLRYGIGHAICWAIVVSAVVSFFSVPQTAPLRRWIKCYFGVYVFNSCFMALYPMAVVVMFIAAACIPGGWSLMVAEDYFIQTLIPKPVECENSDYIIRRWDDVHHTDNSKMFYLYRKGTWVEHLVSLRYASVVEYEQCQALRIVEVDESNDIIKIEIEVDRYTTNNESPRTEIQEWEMNRYE